MLGVGNTLMGDDGVGVAAVRRLVERAGRTGLPTPADAPVSASHGLHLPDALGAGVDAVLGETAGMALIRYFRDSDAVIVADAVDAAPQGAQPGQVFRFTPDDAGLVSLRSTSIHGMGVPHLVAAARLAGYAPEVVVIAVQVGDVRPRGDTLSAPVAAALPAVVELLEAEIAMRRRPS